MQILVSKEKCLSNLCREKHMFRLGPLIRSNMLVSDGLRHDVQE